MPHKITEEEEKLIKHVNELCPLKDPTDDKATSVNTEEEVMEKIYDIHLKGEDWIVLYAMDMDGVLEKLTHIEETYYKPNTKANGDYGLIIMGGKYMGISIFTMKKKRLPLETLKKELGDKMSYFQTNFIVPRTSNMLFKMVVEILTSLDEIKGIRNGN